ncbi:hypothetical protein KJ865_01985 [Myxococcota bacterium]|nr:hypothetical protein [Myxococcota bacterium]
MTGKRLILLILGSYLLVPLVAVTAGWLTSRHSPVAAPNHAEQQEMMALMKTALTTRKVPSALSGFTRSYPGPLFVLLLKNGQIIHRCALEASPLSVALLGCAGELARGSFDPTARIRMDLPLSIVKIHHVPVLRRIFVLPGIEAIMGEAQSGKNYYILPDELFLGKLLASGGQPLKFVKELKMGVNLDAVEQRLANRAGSPINTLYRVKLLSLVDSLEEPGTAKVVLRGNIRDNLAVTRENVLAAAIRGGDYMIHSLVDNPSNSYNCTGLGCRRGNFRTDKGQFLYMYHIMLDLVDFQSHAYYNLPRHAGTTYSLANLYRITKLERFKKGAEAAIAYLGVLASGRCQGPGFKCVANGNYASLGSSALALLAIAEYRLATGDKTYDNLGRNLANFLLFMQRKDGSFRHMYDVKNHRAIENMQLLYYAGEASLALAKSYRAWGEKAYVDAAAKGIDDLIGPQMKQLPFRFAFGEEHWTCQAARAVWPDYKKKAYLTYCLNFADYIGRQQWKDGESAFPDFVGGYGFTPVLPPHANGSGSRTEANVSTWELSRFHGSPSGAVERQIKRAISHILRHQRRPENCWLCANPEHAAGAVPTSPIELETRIDTVQHTTTGLIRAYDALWGEKKER